MAKKVKKGQLVEMKGPVGGIIIGLTQGAQGYVIDPKAHHDEMGILAEVEFTVTFTHLIDINDLKKVKGEIRD